MNGKITFKIRTNNGKKQYDLLLAGAVIRTFDHEVSLYHAIHLLNKDNPEWKTFNDWKHWESMILRQDYFVGMKLLRKIYQDRKEEL